MREGWKRTCLVHLGRLQQHIDDHVQLPIVRIGDLDRDRIRLIQQCWLVVRKRDRESVWTMSNANKNISVSCM